MGSLRPSQEKWLTVSFDAPKDGRQVIHGILHGLDYCDLSQLSDDPRVIGVGMIGAYVCMAEDYAARVRLVEGVALGALDDLAREGPAPA